MKLSLFDRVFTYPASLTVLPNENLATEITAYFLDHWPRFRQRFLREIGILDFENWTIETQRQLYAPGSLWHGKIPDLALRANDGAALVLVEVKIDAGITYSGDIPQTAIYRQYLDNELRLKRFKIAHLLLLTCWQPDQILKAPSDHAFRFTQVAGWLDDCVRHASNGEHATACLASQWIHFLRGKGWAMLDINDSHVSAIKAIGELEPQLWDVVTSARDKILADSARWIRPLNARSSTGKWAAHDVQGQVLWGAAVGAVSNPELTAQPGFFYGQRDGESALCPLVWFHSMLELRGSADLQALVRTGFWGGSTLCFPVLRPKSSRKHRQLSSGKQLWTR
jgi:hypothetical protein